MCIAAASAPGLGKTQCANQAGWQGLTVVPRHVLHRKLDEETLRVDQLQLAGQLNCSRVCARVLLRQVLDNRRSASVVYIYCQMHRHPKTLVVGHCQESMHRQPPGPCQIWIATSSAAKSLYKDPTARHRQWLCGHGMFCSRAHTCMQRSSWPLSCLRRCCSAFTQAAIPTKKACCSSDSSAAACSGVRSCAIRHATSGTFPTVGTGQLAQNHRIQAACSAA